jgi:diaminopimelate epimerase
VGADGVLVFENSQHADFKMRLFNRDGSEGEMCGNGARCIARYAFVENIAPRKMVFETMAGNIYAEVGEVLVKIKMGDIKINGFNEDRKVNTCRGELICNYIIAGVPHCVIFIKDLDRITDDELRGLGREIRFNKEEFPEGTNVNFVQELGESRVKVITYERGVEDLTMACGTGSTASALIACIKKGYISPVEVVTRGGLLRVYFNKTCGMFTDIYLEGEARFIAQGYILKEAWDYEEEVVKFAHGKEF